MTLSIQAIAEAFSRHRFTDAYPYLADDVRWGIVGDRDVVGRSEVISTCTESAAFLEQVTTTFTAFRTLAGPDFVVVDSAAAYGSVSRVGSCDIYRFLDGRLVEVTSYTVELST